MGLGVMAWDGMGRKKDNKDFAITPPCCTPRTARAVFCKKRGAGETHLDTRWQTYFGSRTTEEGEDLVGRAVEVDQGFNLKHL